MSNCDYGQAFNENDKGCIDCGNNNGALAAAHRVPPPTILPSDCDLYNLTLLPVECDRNAFYDAQAYPPDGASTAGIVCTPCLPVSAQCPPGHFSKVCVTRYDDVSASCAPCTIPRLPSTSVFEYGAGLAFPDCRAMQREGVTLDTAACAYFQTPKWGQGYCAVHCGAGFVRTGAAPPFFGLPECTPCQTACPPGTYPPSCPAGGGLAATTAGKCQPCPTTTGGGGEGDKPADANWTTGCEWRCPLPGFYGASGVCVACPSADDSTAVSECLQSEYGRWLGCSGSSAGECRQCDAERLLGGCVSGETFLQAEVHMEACRCAPCTRLAEEEAEGALFFFVARNCSDTADAVLQACDSACARLGVAAYRTANCSRFADTRCVPCTAADTPAARGKRLLAACAADADARYAPCPAEYACNGTSPLPYQCPAPLVARGGLCVCPPATRAGGEIPLLCAPIVCPQGAYPDPLLDGCSNCSSSSSDGGAEEEEEVAARTLPGVLGFGACACPSGFLRRASVGGARQRLECWPCGDLACAPRTERQTRCPGHLEEEPACACGTGPGMALLRPTTTPDAPCASQCHVGFIPTDTADAAAAALAPTTMIMMTMMMHDAFSFLRTPDDGWRRLSLAPQPQAAACPGPKRVVPLGGGAPGDALLVLCGGTDGALLLVRGDTGATVCVCVCVCVYAPACFAFCARLC
jgi:hypothetical protein